MSIKQIRSGLRAEAEVGVGCLIWLAILKLAITSLVNL